MEFIDIKNINQLRNEIDKFVKSGKKVVVKAQNDDFNRKVLENSKVDMIFGFENLSKDRLKQRNSGLNQVLCKLAKKNNISIGVDMGYFDRLDDFQYALALGKLTQNIALCKKYKVSVRLFNVKKNKFDIMCFLLTLGMDTNMAKNSF